MDNSSGSLQCLVCTLSTANCSDFEDLNMGKQSVPPCTTTTTALYLLLINTEYLFSIQITLLSWVHWLSIPVRCQCGKKQVQQRLSLLAGKAVMTILLVVPPSLPGDGLFRVIAGNCSASDQGENGTRLRDIKREGLGKLIWVFTAAAAHPAALTSPLTAGDSLVQLSPLSSWACS